MKRQEYQFFFLNSAIQSVSFVLCVYFFPVLFCFIILGLLFLPIVLGLFISGVTLSMYWIIVVCVTCCVMALYVLVSWMLMRIGVSHFISKTKEHLLLQTIGFVILSALMFLLFQKAVEMIHVWRSVYLVFELILLCAGWLWLKGLSACYVNRMFLQLKVEVKVVFLPKKSEHILHFLTHLRQEFVYFSRSAVFKEQGILFLFLVCLTVGLPFVFSPAETGWLYAFIVQFALKEILIMLPLMIGREYHMNHRAIFMLNTSKGAYLLSRILFYYAINLLIYFVYIGLAYLVTGIESEGHVLASLSILLITVMAACAGFVVKINDFNKMFVILMMIAVFSMLDMLLLGGFVRSTASCNCLYDWFPYIFQLYRCCHVKKANLAMIELLISLIAVVLIHELGHMLMVMVCNKIEQRPLFDYVVMIDWRSTCRSCMKICPAELQCDGGTCRSTFSGDLLWCAFFHVEASIESSIAAFFFTEHCDAASSLPRREKYHSQLKKMKGEIDDQSIFILFLVKLTLAMLYVFAVFMTPVFLLLLEVNHVESSPTVFGMPFYIMKIEKYQFSSEATLFGCAVCFLAGAVLYFLIQYVIHVVKKRRS